MSLDFTTIYSDLYDRAASDAAGAGLRALVGSIFEAKDPINLTGKTLPYLMWRYLPGDGQSGQMVNLNANWWAYVGPAESIRTLTTIGSAVYALYREPLAIEWGRIAALAPRAPFYDRALGLHGIQIPFFYRRLG